MSRCGDADVADRVERKFGMSEAEPYISPAHEPIAGTKRYAVKRAKRQTISRSVMRQSRTCQNRSAICCRVNDCDEEIVYGNSEITPFRTMEWVNRPGFRSGTGRCSAGIAARSAGGREHSQERQRLDARPVQRIGGTSMTALLGGRILSGTTRARDALLVQRRSIHSVIVHGTGALNSLFYAIND